MCISTTPGAQWQIAIKILNCAETARCEGEVCMKHGTSHVTIHPHVCKCCLEYICVM